MIISIELRGFEAAEKSLRGFASTMLDLRPFWPLVVPMFIRWMREQFESEGAWGGSPWAQLTPDYAAAKATRRPGKSILIAEGDLRQAASSPSRVATPSMLILTIDSPTVGFHQSGTTRMPPRPVIPPRLPLSANAELEAAAEAYVAEMVLRFGL